MIDDLELCPDLLDLQLGALPKPAGLTDRELAHLLEVVNLCGPPPEACANPVVLDIFKGWENALDAEWERRGLSC
jgi:hypothetical protein